MTATAGQLETRVEDPQVQDNHYTQAVVGTVEGSDAGHNWDPNQKAEDHLY